MHDTTPQVRLATSWHRGGYVFETCFHWLMDSNPDRHFHQRWCEVFDIDRLKFDQLEEFTRIETEHGENLSVYTDVDRMEAESLRGALEDTAEVPRRQRRAAAHWLRASRTAPQRSQGLARPAARRPLPVHAAQILPHHRATFQVQVSGVQTPAFTKAAAIHA
jgi:phytoene dehydrogenase-like protein